MSQSPATEPASTTSKYRCDGSRLINTPEGFNALALLRQGLSLRKVVKQTGVSINGAEALRRNMPLFETQLKAVDATYRDRNKLLAWYLLDGITEQKIKKAGVGELIKASHDAARAAGLITNSQPQGPQYLAVLNQFNVNPTQQSISSVDVQTHKMLGSVSPAIDTTVQPVETTYQRQSDVDCPREQSGGK